MLVFCLTECAKFHSPFLKNCFLSFTFPQLNAINTPTNLPQRSRSNRTDAVDYSRYRLTKGDTSPSRLNDVRFVICQAVNHQRRKSPTICNISQSHHLPQLHIKKSLCLFNGVIRRQISGAMRDRIATTDIDTVRGRIKKY